MSHPDSGKGCPADRECGWAGSREAAVGLARRASLELGVRPLLFHPSEQMQTSDPGELLAGTSEPLSGCRLVTLWDFSPTLPGEGTAPESQHPGHRMQAPGGTPATLWFTPCLAPRRKRQQRIDRTCSKSHSEFLWSWDKFSHFRYLAKSPSP